MAFSLYDATIPSYLQILGSVSGLMDKAEALCAEKKWAPETLLQTRLAEDMLPLTYQFRSTAWHSLGAIEGVRKGVFSPDTSPTTEGFAELRQRISSARSALSSLRPEEIDGFVGRDMRFEMGSFRIDFTAEKFLLSFSMPNFYFHATTAYDILRLKGAKIGKRDFMGQLQAKA